MSLKIRREKMKIAFILKGTENLEKWASFAHKQEIPGIEFLIERTISPASKEEKPFSIEADFNIKMANEQRKILEKSKVELCAIGLFRINYLDPKPEVREFNHKMLQQVIEYAVSVGCPLVYTDTGELEPGNTERNLEEFKCVFPTMQELAKGKGIQLAIYVGHPGNFINSKRILGWIYKQMPQVRLKLDPVGIIRNLKADPYEVIKDYGDRIIHFHIKDMLRMNGFEIDLPVGMGDLRWNKILSLLYYHNYQGYLSIEPHEPMWSKEEKRAEHIILSKKHIEQFLL